MLTIIVHHVVLFTIPWTQALTSDHHSSDDLLKERSGISRSSALQKEPFGTKAPVMIPDDHVSMCQFCSHEFTIIHRRHHCRACGKVCVCVCMRACMCVFVSVHVHVHCT